jgi:hypothetical protein
VSKRVRVPAESSRVLTDLVHFMDGLPSLPVLLVIAVLVEPALMLLHELGHAVAAASRLPGPVLVRVGGERPLLSGSLGRVRLLLHPIVLPWRFDGRCVYDARSQTRADAVVIALAGPAASFASGLLAWMALHSLGTASPLHALFEVATFLALGTGLICLVPLTLHDAKGTRLRTDGAIVVAAMRRGPGA